jgi:hypothetical protein
MSAEPLSTSDVIGLTKVAPFSRRGFMDDGRKHRPLRGT